MNTPSFSTSQTDTHVIVTIHAPFAKEDATEIEFCTREILFSSPPYFLRLHLPGDIVELSEDSTTFDEATSTFTVKAKKVTPNEVFPHLDNKELLFTAPECENGDHEDGAQWSAEQTVPVEQTVTNGEAPTEDDRVVKPKKKKIYGFGFAQSKTNEFDALKDDLRMILNIPDPPQCSFTNRAILDFESAVDSFDPERYLADQLTPDDGLEECLAYKMNLSADLTEEHQAILTSLKSKNCPPVHEDDTDAVYFSMIDMLFAYFYDMRVTMGEQSCESHWTLAQLCGTLTHCRRYSSLTDVLLNAVRRSLCQPLYRSFTLAMTVVGDVEDVLNAGVRSITRALLDMNRVMSSEGTEYSHLFNALYLDDYCRWAGTIDSDRLKSLAVDLHDLRFNFPKDELNLDLDMLETTAALETLTTENDVCNEMSGERRTVDNEEDMLAMIQKSING